MSALASTGCGSRGASCAAAAAGSRKPTTAPSQAGHRPIRVSLVLESTGAPLAGEPADHVDPMVDILVEGADRQPFVAAVGALVVRDHRPGTVDAVDRHAAGAEIEAVRGAGAHVR